jgi:hypothetical protein
MGRELDGHEVRVAGRFDCTKRFEGRAIHYELFMYTDMVVIAVEVEDLNHDELLFTSNTKTYRKASRSKLPR